MWFSRWVSALAVLLMLSAVLAPKRSAQSSSLPVVPGAAGYGMQTRAGYGCGGSPTVLRVTNLNDSGTGSLRAALSASGPRVVIFEVSGYIDISSNLWVDNPCLTVAGQTAPSPGITVRMVAGSATTMFRVNTHDVLFQHFRVRPGALTCNSAIQMYGSVSSSYNLVFDHMSLSWNQDESILFYPTSENGGFTDATVWRSTMAEGLANAPGMAACEGGGGTGPGHGPASAGRHVAFIQNLIAHNGVRNPTINGDSSTAFINNVVYDWPGANGSFLFNLSDYPGPWYATWIGNRYVVGPNGDEGDGAYAIRLFNQPPANTGNRFYDLDNTITNDAHPGIAAKLFLNELTFNPFVGSPPPQAPIPTGLTIQPSTSVEATVSANAGARPADRDAVDTRLMNELRTRTGKFVRSPDDVGGYPPLAVNSRVLTLPASPHAVSASGYTNLEVWLHGFASAVENGGSPRVPATPTGLTIVSN